MYKILIFITVLLFSGCAENVQLSSINNHTALNNITQNGFAIDNTQAKKLNGKKVKLWGYIDYANTNTCGLKNWYFSLKATKNADAGESIHINTPVEYRFKDIYDDIYNKTYKNRPVLITGILKTFTNPTNFSTLIGIEIDVKSPEDIQFK